MTEQAEPWFHIWTFYDLYDLDFLECRSEIYTTCAFHRSNIVTILTEIGHGDHFYFDIRYF